MGKSTSCFKLITCGGGDAADNNDDFQVSEIKDSNDKRGWSFRKRSARHRVLSNTVITETPSFANKESSECTSINFQPPPDTNVAEKSYSANSSHEKPQQLSLENSQLSEKAEKLSEKFVTETESKVDTNPPESVVITIQAAIRGFLARRALLKFRNVVKLQAAVRGHLVRRHAVGTLRCVQAIVKMQVLVRARHAQQLQQVKHGRNDGSEILGNGNHITKSNVKYTSIEKLLSNRFARQLLESSPKNKPIHVKCDPSKADSAWKWLERWMSVSSLDSAESKKESTVVEQSDDSKYITSVSQLETVIQTEEFCESADSKPTVEDSVVPSEDKEKVTTHDTETLNIEASHSTTSLVKDELEQDLPEMTISSDAKVTSGEIESQQNKVVASDASAPNELNSLSQKSEIDSELPKRSMKRVASDQLETEGTKFGYGSRKASNPTFIAAQSKFEELSSMANSGRSSSLSHQEAANESQLDTISVGTDTPIRTKELFSENSAPYPSRIGGSECGTELSISSTLDSPDVSEVGAIENEREAKDVEGISNPENITNRDVEGNVLDTAPACDLPSSALDQPEAAIDKIDHSVVGVDSQEPALKSEKSLSDDSDLRREKAESVLQDSRASPEASPRSHITVPESQGTPSSQVSVKPKDSKANKTGSTNKRRLVSAGNRSPANATPDSGSRGSREQLPRDQQSGKRRNSFGSTKPDHVDQESRDNSSNNSSLPHFMQATESARAKINANNSPRSSPDVNDGETHVKKRHSLPGASAAGRQGSPRIQRSMSQAQQGTKGNGSHPPHERKWQR
ncbi:Protein IQ-DOMAIN 32 [Senna tora]|uniref:Protein IQ-DOMAIN 32 n=1 Tax=Senna tora TaxID=362788 RepID=A0A834WP91_9FABA|nr:Protein IQ-DOMAIN 32 [Senna tora]